MHKKTKIIKITDLIIQTILLFEFGFRIGMGYNTLAVLVIVLVWQMISCITHYFLSYHRKLKIQRNTHIVILSLFFIFLLYYNNTLKKAWVEKVKALAMSNFPFAEVAVVAIGAAIAMWYFVICFREIKRVLKKVKSDQ